MKITQNKLRKSGINGKWRDNFRKFREIKHAQNGTRQYTVLTNLHLPSYNSHRGGEPPRKYCSLTVGDSQMIGSKILFAHRWRLTNDRFENSALLDCRAYFLGDLHGISKRICLSHQRRVL